jgi:hypothetical protein
MDKIVVSLLQPLEKSEVIGRCGRPQCITEQDFGRPLSAVI